MKLAPVHLLEVGFILEGVAPGAIRGGRLLLGSGALVRPSAALRTLHPRHLLEVVGLKGTRQLIT